jgi:hypothetical protein
MLEVMSNSLRSLRVAVAVGAVAGIALLMFATLEDDAPTWVRSAAPFVAISIGFLFPEFARPRWKIRLFGPAIPLVFLSEESLRRVRWTLRALLLLYTATVALWLIRSAVPLGVPISERADRAGVLISAILGIPAGLMIVAVVVFGDGVRKGSLPSANPQELNKNRGSRRR